MMAFDFHAFKAYQSVNDLLFFFKVLLFIVTLFILSSLLMKLGICPWTLKNYEFVTGLKTFLTNVNRTYNTIIT